MELQQHVVNSCPLYSDLRAKYDDLSDDNNLAAFFRDVLARREEYDKEQEKEAEGA